jgi:hypothetical protein
MTVQITLTADTLKLVFRLKGPKTRGVAKGIVSILSSACCRWRRHEQIILGIRIREWDHRRGAIVTLDEAIVSRIFHCAG